jgi:anti-sigma B factor antagonist
VRAHEDLSIHVHKHGETHVFQLSGSLDLATAPTVRAALLEAAERGDHRIVVDLHRVEFLDSTGLGSLIGAYRRAKEEGGELRLTVPDGQILRLLRITGLLKVFGVYASLEDALAAKNRLHDEASA